MYNPQTHTQKSEGEGEKAGRKEEPRIKFRVQLSFLVAKAKRNGSVRVVIG